MNANNAQSKNVTCVSDINKKWKKRSKLEKNLIISIAIIAIVLFGLVVFLIIKHAAAPNICTTPACVLAASQILSHIDPSVDPCEDFFQFACGNFIKNSHGDVRTSSIKQIEEQVKYQLAEIIMEPIKEDENLWIRSQKVMFQACMNTTAPKNESLVIFKKTLEELNGWPVVVGYQWNENVFDWKYMIYNFRNRGYPCSALLDVGIEQDLENINRRIVTVFTPYINKFEDKQIRFYKAYMVDVAVIFGADRKRATDEMEKVFDFHQNLRKIYENAYMHEKNKNETVNETAVLLESRMTVSKYQELNGEIEWLDFINTILYPMGKITSDDYVIFPKLAFTEAFFRLLYRTHKRTLANYIIWKVIEEIMPYMTKELKERTLNYNCLVGESRNGKTRQEICIEAIGDSYYTFSGPADIMYARKYLPAYQRKQVEEMFVNVKMEFISAVQRASWMDEESKSRALKKSKDIVGIIGAPGDYFNDGIFQDLLGDNYTEVQNGSFFEMLLNQQKIKTDLSILHLHENDTQLEKLYQIIAQVNAVYSKHNAIMLPVGILQGVFYNSDRPMYMNYGAIGSIIGHEITHGFGETGSHYDKNGATFDMWTNATRKAYNAKVKCIITDAEEFVVKDSIYQVNGTLTLEENLADYTGVKVSYAAYNKWIQQHGNEPQLPTISYTPKQLFWISAVSYECFKKNNDSSAQKDSHAHNSFRVTAPLRNNPYFAQDFNCPVGSKMNPPNRCQIY